MRKTWFTHSEI